MKKAAHYLNLPYRVALQYDAEGYWIAEHPELPGCIADGESQQEALEALSVSRQLWIESRLASGLEIPEPREASQYSGKLLLRLPRSLHRDLALEAEAENVSLNTWITTLMAARFNNATSERNENNNSAKRSALKVVG